MAFLKTLDIFVPIYSMIYNRNINTVLLMVFVIGIISMALHYIWKFFGVENKKCRSELQEINSYINRYNAETVQNNFEELNQFMSENKLVGNLWREYDKTLVKDDRHTGEKSVFSTVDAGCFISEETILASRMNLELYNFLPGVFTGLGIFGTFLGLTIGLSQVDLGSANVEVMKDGIKNLLSGMGTAFSTSLWGLFISLPFSYCMKRSLSKTKAEIATLQDKLDSIFIRKPAEFWLADSLRELQNQTKELKTFNTDLAMSIGEALDIKLNESFKPTFEKLLGAITELTHSGSSTLAETISDNAGKELANFGTTLQEVQRSMVSSVENSQEVSRKITDVFENSMKSAATTFTSLFEDLSNRQRLMSEQTEQQMTKLLESVQNSMDNARMQLQSSTSDSAAIMTQSLRDSQLALANSMASSNEITQKLSQNLENNMKSATTAFSSLFADVMSRQQSMVEQTEQHMANLLQSVQDGMENARTQLEKSTLESTSTMTNGLKESSEVLSRVARQIEAGILSQNSTLDNQAKQMSLTLNQAATGVSQAYTNSSNELKEVIAKVEYILKDVQQLMNNAGQAANAFSKAAEPVAQSSKELQNNLRTTTEMHAKIQAAANEAREQLGASTKITAESVEVLRYSFNEIKNTWSAYDNKFGVIRTDLEEVFTEMENGLKDYQKLTNQGLQGYLGEFDNKMADAVNLLRGVIEGLEEIVGEILGSKTA